jgi:hypothetical protein
MVGSFVITGKPGPAVISGLSAIPPIALFARRTALPVCLAFIRSESKRTCQI